MTPDNLRELADALEPMAKAPRFEDFDVPAFCAWVRAQADALPVAWLHDVVQDGDEPDQALSFYRDSFPLEGVGGFRSIGCVPLYTHPAPAVPHHAMLDSHRRLVEQAIQSAEHPSGMSTHDGKARIDASILRRMLAIIDSSPAVPAGWKLVPVEPTPEMLSAVGMMDGYDWHAPGCSPDADHANWYSAMIAAAPAVPQAEPCIGNDPTCPCQDGDACHYRDAADGTKGWPVPQAEPKREPLPGLTPTHRCPACGALWRQCDDASWNLRSALCCGLCDAGRVELVRLLDEPKREPLSDEQIAEITKKAARRSALRHDRSTSARIARAVERAHGIGGSDER